MDQGQIEQRIVWLDEQHRETNEKIKDFENQLARDKELIKKQAVQITSLNDEISRLAGLTTRIHQVDETLQKHRKEVTRQLEAAEKRRSEKEANLEALRKSDYQSIQQRIDKIDNDLKKLIEVEHALETRREEELRISKQVTKHDKQLDKMIDMNASQEERLKSISSANDQLQKEQLKLIAEVESHRKKLEEASGKLDVIADANRGLDVRVGELIGAETERTAGQARWIERQELNIVEYENAWKKWERRFDAIEQQATEFDDRLAAYEEMHRALKQMRTELGELMERLERRITEVSEMQRLGETRMKHDWSTFQADEVKRWNTYKLTSDELWREHERLHDRLGQELTEGGEELRRATQNINQMTEAERLHLGELLSMIREWINELNERTE
jgi:chromosome segregation ATPase